LDNLPGELAICNRISVFLDPAAGSLSKLIPIVKIFTLNPKLLQIFAEKEYEPDVKIRKLKALEGEDCFFDL